MAYISITPQTATPSFTDDVAASKPLPLDVVSRQLGISQQTLVRWVDRHLLDATLGYDLDEHNTEIRTIALRPGALDAVTNLARDYREDVVTRTEARHILKIIDRRRLKRMIRAGDIESVEVDGEARLRVSSLEDYLMSNEAPERIEA